MSKAKRAATKYQAAIGAALELIADEIPGDFEIQIKVSQGLFEAVLFDYNTGEEVQVDRTFEEFPDELTYLLDVARASARRALLPVDAPSTGSGK